jgi:hypothetical protein
MIKKIEALLSAIAIASCCATLAYAQHDIAKAERDALREIARCRDDPSAR